MDLIAAGLIRRACRFGVHVSDSDKLLVEIERARSVYQQAPMVLLVTVVNAFLTAIVLAPVADHTLLTVWVAVLVAVSGGRWVIRQRLFRRALNGGRSGRLATINVSGSLTSGILWGIGAFVLFPAAETYQVFLAFVVGGMCAGSTSINSAHMPTVLAFMLPASLPLAARFLAEGSAPWFVAGLMTLVFACALSLASLRAHLAFGEHVRLQLELGRQGRALAEINERLRGEVAERVKAEAALHQAQKIEAIGHLTGGIAHDFNNLLQVVSGNLNMIGRAAGSNDRILGYVRAAQQAAAQGSRLTDSLLAFARRQSLQVERVDVNTLLQEFQPILLPVIDARIRLQTVLAADLPLCEADPAHFQSAILNVVINARDAMPDGGELSITTLVMTFGEADLLENPDAKPGRFVGVAVRDTGTGMSPEVLNRVFEPFFTTKAVGKGSGLGLSQVYGFAHQSGGHVHLESRSGGGTCVTIWLPAVGD
jgi:signal transduction histidine kinase